MVRIRSREGEEVEWSRKAARRAGTLRNSMDDAAPPDDDVYPAEAVSATVLHKLRELCEPDYVYSADLEHLPVPELLGLIDGANFLAADQALIHAQHALAAQLNGKSAEELRALLGVANDVYSVEERAAALAEAAFTPEFQPAVATGANYLEPPMLQRPPSLLGISDDSKEVALEMVDVGTLAEIKGLSQSWRAIARRVLCSRLCQRAGQPTPMQLDDVTDLNVECLAASRRLWEATSAGRLLPSLTRLNGFGFMVDVLAVRAAQLPAEADNHQALGGTALRGCITPSDGEPPLELLIAAVACAGQGTVWGIPVQQLRGNSAIGHLNLARRDVGSLGVQLLSCLLPCATTVASLK